MVSSDAIDSRPVDPNVARSGVSVRASRKPRTIHALTGIRGYAAIWIVTYHFIWEWIVLFPRLSVFKPMVSPGHLAVDLFFILSGFVLSYNYTDGFSTISIKSYARFLWLRLARVYPVHLFTLLVVLATFAGARAVHRPVTDYGYTGLLFIQNLFLVQAWTPYLTLSWNYPAWSISCEWFAYLMFPILSVGLSRLKRPGNAMVALLWGFALMQLGAVIGPRLPFFELTRVGTEFLVGCLLRQVVQATNWRRLRLDWIALLIAGAILAIPALGWTRTWLMLSLFSALVLLLGASFDRWLLPLRCAPAIILGEVSYSLYMTHAVVQKVLHATLPTERFEGASLLLRSIVLFVSLFSIAGAAIATYYLVERPGREALRRFALRSANGNSGHSTGRGA